MTELERANFTRMANALEEEIFKLRKEIEDMKSKELEVIERRMKDKIKIGELEKELSMIQLLNKMANQREIVYLDKIKDLEAQLNVKNEMPGIYPAYCGTGKEQ